MDGFLVGNIAVTEAIETAFSMPVATLLPKATQEEAAEYRQRLGPRFFDAAGDGLLTIRTYMLKTRHHTILVDTCFGNHKTRTRFVRGHMRSDSFLARLKSAGVLPHEVDFVFCTHMHLDHVGWNTYLDNGRWVPTFPKAKYLFPRADWEHFEALAPNDSGADCIEDSVRPVVEAGLSAMVDPGYALADVGEIIDLSGHTPGHAGLLISSAGRRAVFTGDLFHHAVQICNTNGGMRGDTDPAQSVRTRTAFVERYADSGVLLLAAHFPMFAGGYIAQKGGEFGFAASDGLGVT